jgi:hypothetical protein
MMLGEFREGTLSIGCDTHPRMGIAHQPRRPLPRVKLGTVKNDEDHIVRVQ